MRKIMACFAAAMLFLAVNRSALATEPKDLPRPTDYVSDFAHVLSPQAIEEIDRVCAQLDHSSADTQIAIVTIRSVNGADVAEYAKELGNTWGVGRKETNRGILVLLVIDEHKWRISIGRGLEVVLPNSRAESIGEKMIPLLRANDFDGAVKLVVHEIDVAVSAKGLLPPNLTKLN